MNLRTRRKEAVVTYFDVQNLPGGAEENHSES
jgi:hypothetical protein